MLPRLLAAAIAAAASFSAVPATAGAAAGDYLVIYDRSVSSPAAETARQERARGFNARFEYGHAVKGFAARLGPGQVEALRDDPDVAAVVPDRPVHATEALAPGEPLPPTGVRRIRAATADTVSEEGAAVAVLDTGIDLDHPDLSAVDAVNCVPGGTTADDDNGHGTHVAGTISAANNGSGVVGVAPGTTLYAVKVLDDEGDGSWASVICGLDWVAANASTHDIAVANMSLGGPGDPRPACPDSGDAAHAAICGVVAAGVLPVVAAGNAGEDFAGTGSPFSAEAPAVYREVLTVSAIADRDGSAGGLAGSFSCVDRQKGLDDTPAGFSNYATRPADSAHLIAAPGLCITSDAPGGGTAVKSGTSMATPHVAGAVARCVSDGGVAGRCAGMSPGQIVVRMRADAAAVLADDPSYGFTAATGRDHGPLVATGVIPESSPVVDPGPGATSSPPPSDPGTATVAAGQTEETTPPIVIDTTAPTATLAAAGRRLGALTRLGLPVVVRCGEDCSVKARLVVGAATARRLGLKPGRPLARAGSSSLGSELRLVLRPGARARKRLRGLGRLRAKVVVTVTDAAGNADRITRRVTLER